ncbi:MAG: preprotein translocase subunit SecY [Candidatus Hermodarchaeia archaeon]
MSRFLRLFRPFVRVMPEVKAPDRKVSFREKFVWTAVILIIYLVMANLPLFGISPDLGFDYFFWLRTILASQRGTLMELGIGPIVTAGLIMQLLVGSQLIRVDMSDPFMRSLYTGAQKVLAIFMTAFQSVAYIYAGAYGTLGLPVAQGGLPIENAVLVFLQLMVAGIIVILMDETIQKGWGLGSGVSLFIMANVCTQILWGMFSIVFAQNPDVPSTPLGFAGIFPYTIANIAAWSTVGFQPQYVHPNGPIASWFIIWLRPENPRSSMLGVVTTIIVFILVIYMESYRVNIPLQYARYRGFRGQYPIKLLYVSNIPVIFTQALYANILFITQILWTNPGLGLSNGSNPLAFWFWIIARYTPASQGNYLIPDPLTFVWFLTPPTGLTEVLYTTIPGLGIIRGLGYGILLVLFCAAFARLWIDVSGIGPRDISRQLIGAGMQVPGFRRSPQVIEKILQRYIPVVAVLGGIIIGVLAAGADFLGSLSTGIGILLAVGIMRQYFEILAKEQMSEMHPMMAGLLGIG